MKKRNDSKKEVKKIKKTVDSMVKKRRNQREPDLWKEIRSNLKPLGKAYNKFKEKRRITKQKEEERRLKEEEKQKIREEAALRLQEQKERRFKKEKEIKEEEERKLKAQEKQRLDEIREIEETEKRIRQEQIYRVRLMKGEEERIEQLKRVNALREEEKKLIEERNLKIEDSLVDERRIKDEEQQKFKGEQFKGEQQKLKEEEQRLKEEERRLKEEEQRLKKEEQRLKEEEHRLKEEEIINSKEGGGSDDEKNKKRLNGTVKWFKDAKGYGFIKREDKEKDVFVHSSAIQNSDLKYLKKGDQLTFEVEYSDKGPTAVNLQKIDNDTSRPHLKVIK